MVRLENGNDGRAQPLSWGRGESTCFLTIYWVSDPVTSLKDTPMNITVIWLFLPYTGDPDRRLSTKLAIIEGLL